MNTVLILVTSSEEHDYKRLRQAQRDTWGSVQVEGVRQIFYTADPSRERAELVGDTLFIPCDPDYWRMGWKAKLALDFLADAPETFIFHTNNTSYVCKRRLIERAQELPTTRCYAGRSAAVCTSQNGNGWVPTKFRHVSGDQVFWSRDCTDIVRSSMKNEPEVHLADGEWGIALKDIPIIDGDRYDYYDPATDFRVLRDTYVYRCRFLPDRDTDKTIEAFLRIHEYKQQLKRA